MARRHQRPGRGSFLASATVHVVAIALAWWSAAWVQPEQPVFESFRIEIVSPPPALMAEEPTPAPVEEELVVETPEPAEPEPEETPPPPVEEKPEEKKPPPETKPEPEKKPEPPPEKPPEQKPEQAAGPDAEPSARGGDNMNVRMEGLKRDYPAYYGNIIEQIHRCFRPPQGVRAKTVVYFVIEHDGSVSDTRFVTRSGNVDFDYEALGAVECAGRNQRFGPLPEDMPIDRLPVQFTFEPLGTGVGGPPGRPPEGDPSPVRKPS